MEMTDDVIDAVRPRKNRLSRPPVANVDMALVVVTLREPRMSFLEVDRRLVLVHLAKIRPAVVLGKTDLLKDGEISSFLSLYRAAGYEAVGVSARSGEGLGDLRRLLRGQLAVLSGPSGVGKSSVLSALTGQRLETGSLAGGDRGRQTTKHVELLPVGGGFVADTPGFAAADFPEMRRIDLQQAFPDILAHRPGCRFADCLHLSEPDCAVKDAVASESIRPERYASYRAFLEEVREPWSRSPRPS